MAIKIKSLSLKVALLYIVLAIINMSFFAIMIFENQIDLISENNKFHIEKDANVTISALRKLADETNARSITQINTKDDLIARLNHIMAGKKFCIFSDEGKIQYQSHEAMTIKDHNHFKNILSSITHKTFAGKEYYSRVDENQYSISFYVPLKLAYYNNSVLYFNMQMENISSRLKDLYRLIIEIISAIALFHIIFGLALFRFIIKPIKELTKTSISLAEGNLDVRANINRADEIGQLGASFNAMADSLQQKITALERHNKQVHAEMKIAGDVQKKIFPSLEDNPRLNFSLFYKAFAEVSGDYYDLFKLDDSAIGILIVDVSGHGVPAALITMVAKEEFRRYAPHYKDPAELFKKINSEIFTILSEQYINPVFFTAFYMIIDKSNMATYCNAGHPEQILIKTNKRRIAMLNTNGFIVGISEDMNPMFESANVQLESGDKIILFTDGILEAKNEEKEEYGEKRLVDTVKQCFNGSVNEIEKYIIDDVGSFTDIEDLKDDATIFIIEVK